MTDPGTIQALVGLGHQLSGRCENTIKSLKKCPANPPQTANLGVIQSYCAILQAAIDQICGWAASKLPESSIPTSSVIAAQAATADLLEFVELLHNELQSILDTESATRSHGAGRKSAEERESTLDTLTQQIQMLAGSLQLMVAATMMPIEDSRSVRMAISHATESISSNWKSMKSDWDLQQGLSGVSLENSLFSSPVYRRVSRYELEGTGISTDSPIAQAHVPRRTAQLSSTDAFAASDLRQRSGLYLQQVPSIEGSYSAPETSLDHSPYPSARPSTSTETNRTLGRESHVRLLPSHPTSEGFGLPSGLIAIQPGLIPADQAGLNANQPGLIPVEQPGLIAVGSKHDARNGLIPMSRNRLLPHAQQSAIAESTQSLVLSLDGDGFLGSYCHLLVLKNLFQKIATFESSELNGELSSLDIMAASYFDEIVGTGTGGVIAILIGRLQLPLGECVKAFEHMGTRLFDPHNFDTTRGLSPIELAVGYRRLLKQVVRETLETYSYTDRAAPSFYSPRRESCRTVITSFDLSYSGSSTGAHTFYSSLRSRDKQRAQELLRGYRNPEIWRVCLTTLEHRLSVQPSLLKDVPFIDECVQERGPAVRLYRKILSENGNDPRSIKALICMGTRERSGKAAASQPWNYSYEWLSKQTQAWGGLACYRFEMHRKFKAFSLDSGNNLGVQSKLSTAETLAQEYLTSEVVQNGLTMCAKLLVESRQWRARQQSSGAQ